MKENAAAPSDQLTVFTKAVLGSVAATAEALINNPLAVIKTRMQSNRPFTLKPSILMSGVWLNAVGMAPMVATQVTIDDLIKNRKNLPETTFIFRFFGRFFFCCGCNTYRSCFYASTARRRKTKFDTTDENVT